MTLAATLAKAAAPAANSAFSMRNRLINGAMRVQQRGAVSVGSGVGTFSVMDRWLVSNGTGVTMTAGSLVGTEYGSYYAYGLGGPSIVSGQSFDLIQRIEAANIADLAGKKATISFQVATTLSAPTGIVYIGYPTTTMDDFSSVTYDVPGGYAFVLDGDPNVRKSITVDIPANCVRGLQLNIRAQNGATMAGSYVLNISTIQLEAGPAATPFERRPHGFEENLCFRYYCRQQMDLQIPGASGSGLYRYNFKQRMRATPTVNVISSGSAQTATVNAASGNLTSDGGYFQISTSGTNGFVLSYVVEFNAEL